MSPSHHQELLRRIPGVDEILALPQILQLLSLYPRPVVVSAIRKGLEGLRKDLLAREEIPETAESLFSAESLLPRFQREIDRQVRPRLRPVINATGVVVHTNLGRSPLHPSALQCMLDISRGYSNLEFDLLRGERGSRHSHVEEVLCRLSGAESALVVNNNAAAVLLTLNTLAEGKEVIVSRGELVEIGGAFRIPDVMKRSGATLKEVGTTNRTYLSDYERAIGPETALLLKVHTSNFRVMGFSSEASHQDLVDLGRRYHLPVVNDLGSGCFVDLSRYGLEKEPTVQEAVKAGLDIITFSGDKLLGGPQAGVIVGRKSFLDRIKVNPMTRALRIDKLTLAALEATLLLYLDEERAVEEIPTLRMLCVDTGKLKRRGNRLFKRISGVTKEKAKFTLRTDVSQVGGGALPLQQLPTIVLAVRPFGLSPNRLEENLRRGDPPIVSRIHKDELLFDMRTVFDHEIPLLAKGIEAALA
jgi:L-seryl-tRNA(Ser) seleniumtransferase